jgi:hypothetical protein
MLLNEAMEGTDDLMGELIRLGVAIRRAGTTARHRNADNNLIKLGDHDDLRKHLVQILLGQPTKIENSRKQHKEDQHQKEQYRNKKNTMQAIKLNFSEDSLTPTQQHLINANLKRRNRFLYAREHGEKLALHRNQLTKQNQNQKQKQKYHDASASVKEPFKPNATSEAKSQKTEERGHGTQSVAGASSNTKFSEHSRALYLNTQEALQRGTSQPTSTTQKMDYPMPPPKAKKMRPFRCPCCWQTLPSNFSKTQWK